MIPTVNTPQLTLKAQTYLDDGLKADRPENVKPIRTTLPPISLHRPLRRRATSSARRSLQVLIDKIG
jgi:hypothetical protein